ncbi:MAG: tetratricopeptide repeat protein [Balneolaceae bacterium]
MENQELHRRIRACINGSLSPEETDELWIEFLENPDAFEQFQTELHLADLFLNKGYTVGQPADSKKKIIDLSSYKVWLYAAAAAVLLAAGLQFFSLSEADSFGTFALNSIDAEQMVGSVVFRNEDAVEAADLEINQALSNALMGDLERSYQQFSALLGRELSDEQRARVLINSGILEYNRMNYARAAAHFREVLDIDEITLGTREKAWWFLGNALLNIGDVTEAREAVFTAYGLDGQFQRPALALLKRIDSEMQRQGMQTDGQTLPEDAN